MLKQLITVACFLPCIAFSQADSTHTTRDLDKRKYLAIDEIGGLFGFTGNSAGKYFFSYHTVNAYQFSRYAYIGFGTGIEVSGKSGFLVKTVNSKNSSLMIPLYLEYRATLGNKKVAPIISQKAGYSFYIPQVKPGITGGAMAQSQIGFKVFIGEKATFNFSVGYRLQYLNIPAQYHAQFTDMIAPLPGADTDKLPRSHQPYHFGTLHVGFTY